MHGLRLAVFLLCVCGLFRTALAELKAVWVGQVERDLVGPSAKVGPSDTQDLQFRLEGLEADKEIENIRIIRRGGGEWQYKGPWGAYAAVIERQPGSASAEVFVEPQYTENAHTWDIIVRYADGSTQTTQLQAGRSDRNLRMPDAV